jgi:biotin carboxylase
MNDRLLVLGAGSYQLPVIRRALDLGCHVVVADYLPGNPGHAIASASEIVSTVDLDGVLDVARRHRVHGVLTYGSDVSAPAVAYVSERLGLPGNPYETAALLQRKDRIRELQRRTGLPHPQFVYAEDGAELAARAVGAALPFPALVKPADASGSKGQSVVTSADDLPGAFGVARPFARCGVVVAEELRPDDTTELVFEAFIEDGRLAFGHYGHNWFCDETHPRVPVGEIFPGAFDAALVGEIDRQIQTIVTAAGVRSGCMNFDALLSRGEVVIVDLGLRNGGNFVPDAVALSTGVDLTTAAIDAALGRRAAVPALHVAAAACIVSYILHTHAPGQFAAARADEVIAPHLIDTRMFARPGDEVRPYTRGDAGLGVVLFRQPSVAEARALVARTPHLCEVTLESVVT